MKKTFRSRLFDIKNDIDKHKDIDLISLVDNRLNKTFNLYVNDIEMSYKRLLAINELRMLKYTAKE